jgi:hypothetical protein
MLILCGESPLALCVVLTSLKRELADPGVRVRVVDAGCEHADYRLFDAKVGR